MKYAVRNTSKSDVTVDFLGVLGPEEIKIVNDEDADMFKLHRGLSLGQAHLGDDVQVLVLSGTFEEPTDESAKEE